MSFNIRNYVSDNHIESIGEIARGQANIIQALSLDNSQKDKEIERLHSIIKEVRNQLSYLETYSSKEDVFEDMKRRLDRIEKIIGSDKE